MAKREIITAEPQNSRFPRACKKTCACSLEQQRLQSCVRLRNKKMAHSDTSNKILVPWPVKKLDEWSSHGEAQPEMLPKSMNRVNSLRQQLEDRLLRPHFHPFIDENPTKACASFTNLAGNSSGVTVTGVDQLPTPHTLPGIS